VHDLAFTPRAITTETCNTTTENGHVFLDPMQGLYLCRNGNLEIISDTGNSTPLQEMTLAKDGDVINKPTCATGTNTVPQIFVSPAIASVDGTSSVATNVPPIDAFQAYAVNTSPTTWTVHLRLLPMMMSPTDTVDWINPDANHGRIIVSTTCAKGS